MLFFSVNMSGKTIPIYSSYMWDDPNGFKQLGVLYNREACCFFAAESCYVFYFSDPSGNLTYGWHPLNDRDGNPVYVDVSPCLDYPYGKEVIDGQTYWTFKFRRNQGVYTAAGNRWGTVASGMRIATRSEICGQTHPDWMEINYVERSTDHQWIKVTGDGYSYGFVDTGLNISSFPTTIPMYGSW